MSNQKKQSFLGGAAILAAAVVVVKFIGFFYNPGRPRQDVFRHCL